MYSSQSTPYPPVAPTISQPIQYYTEDTLNFNTRRKNLYGEIYSDVPLINDDMRDATVVTMTSPPQSSLATMLIYISIAILSLASLALYATVIPFWERNFEHTRFPLRGDWTDGLMLLPLSISVISATALSVSSIRQRRAESLSLTPTSPLSPFRSDQEKAASESYRANRTASIRSSSRQFYKILLAATLILLLIPLLVLSTTNSLARAFRAPVQSISPAPTYVPGTNTTTTTTTSNDITLPEPQLCTKANVLTKPCMPILYLIGNLQISASATTGAATILWIVILIISIRGFIQVRREDKHQRRRHRRQRRQQRNDDSTTDGNHKKSSKRRYKPKPSTSTTSTDPPRETTYQDQDQDHDQNQTDLLDSYYYLNHNHDHDTNDLTNHHYYDNDVGHDIPLPSGVEARAGMDVITNNNNNDYQKHFSYRASEQIIGLQKPSRIFRPPVEFNARR